MAARGAPGGAAGPGAGVPAIRPPLGRLIPAALALLCLASALAETALAPAHQPRTLLLGLEAAGLVCLGLVLWGRRPALVVPAVAVAAVSEGVTLTLGGPVALAPLLGGLLLLSCELAFWSIDRSRPAVEWVSVGVFRGVWLAGLALAGAALGLGLTLASRLPFSGGFDLTALGILALIALAALLLASRRVGLPD